MSIKIIGKYIGDGFVPLGYPFMQTDKLEVTVNPSFNMFKEKVQFMGSIGRRINNLSGARAATNTQTVASVNINYQYNEQLSLQAAFSNFDFRNSIKSDTLKIEMVTSSWSIGPTYAFTTPLNAHIFTGMYAISVFKDFNTISGAINDNDSRSTVISYMLAKVKNPLSLSAIFSNFNNNTSIGALVTNSYNLSIGYKFLNNKLKTNTGLTLTKNKLSGSDAGTQVMTTLGLKYILKRKVDFAINGSINLFKYGIDRSGISYRENLLRTSIMYKF